MANSNIPRIHILSIGDELLAGKTLNSNAAHFGEILLRRGWPVRRVLAVGDGIDEIAAAFGESWLSADVVIATGGLGTTHDDITREAVQRFFRCGTVVDPQALESLRTRLRARGTDLGGEEANQARIPGNSRVILNPEGTAPGFSVEEEGRLAVFLPGVPHECRRMFADSVVPMIESRHAPASLLQRRIRTAGIGESKLFAMLDRMKWLPPEVRVAFLPSVGCVDIDVSGQGEPWKDTVDRIRKTAARFVYSEGEPGNAPGLAQAVGELLAERGATLAVAESCTGGLLADSLTDVSGSSRYFLGAAVAYENLAKRTVLGVSSSTLESCGAVSAACAREMAANVRRVFGSDFGVSTTGIAGPTGGTPWKPVGLVYIGLADAKGCEARKFVFPDSRRVHKERSVNAALSWLRERIAAAR